MTKSSPHFTIFFLLFSFTHAVLFPEEADETATGYRAFIEEYRHDLQHSDYLPSHHYSSETYNVLLSSPQPSGCLDSLPQGLVEFTDFGPMNDLPFTDLFVVSPGHDYITGKTHFAFLDAHGARLKNGVLEVLIEGGGFRTKGQGEVDKLSMHYETSALGYGRGDSQALAPPLSIQAVTVKGVINEIDNSNCYCDYIVPHKVSYVMGLLYYPQYGHTLFNGLSNMVATLWRKDIPYKDVEFSPYLFRNTSTLVSGVPAKEYLLKWFDMYDEVFKFHSSSIVQWSHMLDVSKRENKTVCFQRILVGALPHLDLMNISVPSSMWSRYARGIVSAYYWNEIVDYTERMKYTVPHNFYEVTEDQLNSVSPPYYPNYHLSILDEVYDDSDERTWKASSTSPYCAVTIITREIYNARSITNANELISIASERGCTVQVLALEKLSIKEQIGEVRWNTTLLIAVEGTALFNSIFMHKCSSVLHIDLWKRKMMYPKFDPVRWFGYTTRARDTSFVNMSDPIAIYLDELISNYTAAGRQQELESLKLDMLPFSNKLIEDFLRNQQSTHVNIDEYYRILDDSIRHNIQCRRVKSNTKMTFKLNNHRAHH